MNFFNDEIHEEMLALYRDFASGVCAPIAAEIDEEEKFPVETFKQAAEMGLMGIPFPEATGEGDNEVSEINIGGTKITITSSGVTAIVIGLVDKQPEIKHDTNIIPEGATYVTFSTGSSNRIFEIVPVNRPNLSAKLNYSTLTENGVEVGKNIVTLKYFDTSTKNLYKIDDGDWLEYTGPITLDYGKTIYAKGILPSGKDSDIVSHTSVLPGDAIRIVAYDGDLNTSQSVNKALKLLIGNEMQGRKVSITTSTSCGSCETTIKFYSEDNTLLNTQIGKGMNIIKEYSIPNGATYLILTNEYSEGYVYEVKPVTE